MRGAKQNAANRRNECPNWCDCVFGGSIGIRLTNGFSKKLENHQAAVAPWIALFNLCRVHETLRCTPAMAIDVADHIWTIAELAQTAFEPGDVVPPSPSPTPETTLRPGYRPFRLRVIQGGKMSKTRLDTRLYKFAINDPVYTFSGLAC